ncbi:MAG: alpha-rhamnosidase [Firmicutes bacterium]|nr:alpha-rhamnosidase [Bacillota bacterium]
MGKGVWIWYPGDYEHRLARNVVTQRYYRDSIIPPSWRTDDCYSIAAFCRDFEFTADDILTVKSLGKVCVSLDGREGTAFDGMLPVKKGKHHIEIRVYNSNGVPSVCVDGRELCSDAQWTAVYGHEQRHSPAAVGYGDKPVGIKFNKTPIVAEKVVGHDDVYDFGTETMGYIIFWASGKGKVRIYYGESLEECLDTAGCELTDTVAVQKPKKYKTPLAKAFRYVNLKYGDGVSVESVAGVSEFLPIENQVKFDCGDALLNEIYRVSEKTLHLCTREFFLDGIKRDRWIWGGDAYQSYLMNYYSFNDPALVKRTMLALAGKPPYDRHVNRIPSYTFFWLIGFADYFERTGDTAFCSGFFSAAAAIADFCVSRANERGLIDDRYGDWMYVDWADGLDDSGEVAYNNILYYAALKKFAMLCAVFDQKKAGKYSELAENVLKTVMRVFWSEERQCFVYNAKDKDKSDPSIKRQPNIMAVLFDVVSEEQQKLIIQNVLLNDAVDKITTPYMRFFELDALAKAGHVETVIDEIKTYWGGMLSLGATSFWEAYDPRQKGAEHYAMYGRPYGKSLCHAWGAAPLYLLGRYAKEMLRTK